MSISDIACPLPRDQLAEQWFGFMHQLIGKMQEAFRRARDTGKINKTIIAERLGKDPATITRCLSGQQNMRIRTVHDIARAMNCRLEVNFVPLETLPPTNRPRRSDAASATPTETVLIEVNTAKPKAASTALEVTLGA